MYSTAKLVHKKGANIMTPINWIETIDMLQGKFPDQFAEYSEIKPSSISGSGVHANDSQKEGIPFGIYLGITHIYTGLEEAPQVLVDRGFRAADYGPPALQNVWLRTNFGRMLNAPNKPGDINAKSVHFDKNGDRLIETKRNKQPEPGDIKVLFCLVRIHSEILAGYTIGYNPADTLVGA
ncbi:MAG: hypothetical protein ACI9SY_000164 [Candidatus Paceibacteria bacterium]